MELINTLKELKKEFIKYIVDIANNHCLDYLYKEKIDNVYRYCVVIDYNVICTYNLEETLEQQSTDSLAELYEKIESDIVFPKCESGHDYKLIDEINRLYKEQHEDFINILQFLIKRDRSYIERFYDDKIDIEDTMFIEKQATTILIHLCNDDDLQCIISYCKGNENY